MLAARSGLGRAARHHGADDCAASANVAGPNRLLPRRRSHEPPRHREAGDCAANTAGAGRPLSFDQRHCTIMYSLLMSFNLYHDETAVGKPWSSTGPHIHGAHVPTDEQSTASQADICQPCHRTHKLTYDLIPPGWNGSL
jgi:hypothetical protein